MPKMQEDSRTLLGKGGVPRHGVHLDPRTKLAAIAAMALAVALAPNVTCEFALMCLAVAFGCALGKGKASAGMLVLYMASVAVAQLVPYLDNVALRTMLASFFSTAHLPFTVCPFRHLSQSLSRVRQSTCTHWSALNGAQTSGCRWIALPSIRTGSNA